MGTNDDENGNGHENVDPLLLEQWEQERKRLGERIKSLRIARGFSSVRAATDDGKLGIKFGQLNNIERGVSGTSLLTLQHLLHGLDAAIEFRVRSERKAPPTPDGPPPDRWDLARRFIAVVQAIPEKDLEVLVEELADWEEEAGLGPSKKEGGPGGRPR